MKGAKVDGKLVSLDYQLQTGEIVEILTSQAPDHGPNRAWLDICKTNEAKSKIRSWFKKERREENIAKGKEDLEHEFKRNGINVPPEDMEKFLADDMKRHNCATLDDFYAAVGYGGIILSRILQRLKDSYAKQYSAPNAAKPAPFVPKKSNTGIIVGGESNIDVKLSKCCNPLPGEDIIGFITKGHGVSVHRKDCSKYIEAMKNGIETDRWVEVTWAENAAKNDNPIFNAGRCFLRQYLSAGKRYRSHSGNAHTRLRADHKDAQKRQRKSYHDLQHRRRSAAQYAYLQAEKGAGRYQRGTYRKLILIIYPGKAVII